MARYGPIIVIDDDLEDQQLLIEVVKDLGISNEVICFSRCADGFHFLKSTASSPLVIFCDLNLPSQNGIDFKRQIDTDPQLRSKSIPFIFFSTHVDRRVADTAYKELTVQGFFQKPVSYKEMQVMIKLIVDYWKLCIHPNS